MAATSRATKIWRGLTKRCARCGEHRLFKKWVTMVERCPRCGHKFERAQGFWLGSIMINSAFTMGLFLLVFVGGMVVTWPDTPWTGLLVATLLLNAIFPVAFHPFSRTIWVGLEMAFHSLEPAEEIAAAAHGTGDWSIGGLAEETSRN